MVKDVLIAGIVDAEIQKKSFGVNRTRLKGQTIVVGFVKSKGIAQSAWSVDHTSYAAVLLTYKKSEGTRERKLALKDKCKKYNRDIALSKEIPSMQNQ